MERAVFVITCADCGKVVANDTKMPDDLPWTPVNIDFQKGVINYACECGYLNEMLFVSDSDVKRFKSLPTRRGR